MPGARGEGTLALADGREVQVLYTNRALAQIEQDLGRSILAVAQGFASNQSGIKDVAVMLRHGMEAQRRYARMDRRAVTLLDAFEVLDAVGLTQVAEVVMLAVSDVLGYGAKSDDLPGDDDPNF